MSDTCCHDCLEPFRPDSPRFVVFNPTGNEIRDEDGDIIACGEERLVCAGCAGWYREGAEITAVEAEAFA